MSLPTGLPAEDISRDAEVVRAYVADPLVHDLIGARMFTELVGNMDLAHDNAKSVTAPTLVMHGTADKVTPIDGSRRYFEAIASQDKALETFDGAYHELHNDLCRVEAMDKIVDWFGRASAA